MVDNFKNTKVAYFSMEIALENDLKTYAGGLGVLAGDLLRAASELKFPMVGITLLNPQGYLKQKINFLNKQIARPDINSDFSKLKKLGTTTEIYIGKEKVKIGVWQYLINGEKGFKIPVYFLDTNLKINSKEIRKLSGRLYGGNRDYRLKQEIVLGRGGVKILRALGYKNISKIHLNEGHGSLAALELFLESKKNDFKAKLKEVRDHCVFTTHTSIPHSQEVFEIVNFLKYQPDFPSELKEVFRDDKINFTLLGFYFSSYVNAVSKTHQAVVNKLYPGFNVNSNTNGVDSIFWTGEEFKSLYDRYILNWRTDNAQLVKAVKIPRAEIVLAHRKAKNKLIDYVNKISKVKLSEDIFTIGYARRFTSYKRPEFLLFDLKKLIKINNEIGKIQIIYSGKAHANDLEGQRMIKDILNIKRKLKGKIKIVFLENYDLDKAKLLVSGVDLWLNTPQLYYEACGTSGMKAAHNGVPQLSTLDGWWPEGHKEGETGWAIIEKKNKSNNPKKIESNLHSLLSKKIIPLFYKDPEVWADIMRNTISINASCFNSQRNLKQYIKEAYRIKK